jgi:putative addiction module component (TIGR02574 family)
VRALRPRRASQSRGAVRCTRLLAGEAEAYNQPITKPMASVLADALRLDDDARAELAAELIASLDGPPDPDAESAWDAEIERRIAAIEGGTIPLESWEQVRRRIEKDILGR